MDRPWEIVEACAGLPFLPEGSGAGPSSSVAGPFGNAFDPAVSEAQRRLFAIAEHHPEKLHKANKGLAKLPHKTLHEFASKGG